MSPRHHVRHADLRPLYLKESGARGSGKFLHCAHRESLTGLSISKLSPSCFDERFPQKDKLEAWAQAMALNKTPQLQRNGGATIHCFSYRDAGKHGWLSIVKSRAANKKVCRGNPC